MGVYRQLPSAASDSTSAPGLGSEAARLRTRNRSLTSDTDRNVVRSRSNRAEIVKSEFEQRSDVRAASVKPVQARRRRSDVPSTGTARRAIERVSVWSYRSRHRHRRMYSELVRQVRPGVGQRHRSGSNQFECLEAKPVQVLANRRGERVGQIGRNERRRWPPA
jgi:hypothetical protein